MTPLPAWTRLHRLTQLASLPSTVQERWLLPPADLVTRFRFNAARDAKKYLTPHQGSPSTSPTRRLLAGSVRGPGVSGITLAAIANIEV